MGETETVDRLAAHKTIGGAPREELAWLAEHGAIRHLDVGDVLTRKGTPVAGLFIVLSGRITMSVDRGTGTHKVMEWREGDVTGVLPYSRLVGPPADAIAAEPTDVFAIPRDQLHAMIRACDTVTSILVHTMLDRVRAFRSSELHDEKLLSLGKLSAGLAHELNNPASAIERSAALLERGIEESEGAARALWARRLTDAQITALDAVQRACVITRERGVRSPIAQAQHEEAMAEWLERHHAEPGIADALSDAGVAFDTLDQVASVFDGAMLENALRWIASTCSVRRLASEIQGAATRISVLVKAIKGFTHMDQATAAEAVDIARGIDDTVTVLRAKARSKSVTVTVDIEPGLPKVLALVGELNQIWANLIDNALDAVPAGGRVEVNARAEQQRVAVRIIDNGPGIPDQVRERIFDPFFTTKPVGQGTGLGLDIVRRLIQQNDGDISMESQPGRTEFRVTLAAVAPAPDGTAS